MGKRFKPPKPTKFDMALSKVAPRTALRRYRDRCRFEAISSYTGANKKRRSMARWDTPSGDFDTDILGELPDLREKSEDLYRNNMIAAGAINTEATSVVGRGLTVHPRIDADFLGLSEDHANAWESAASRRWKLFSESKFCTVNKKHNFREYTAVAFLSSLIRGDSFTLTPEKEPLPYFPFRLRLQLIEADRVCNKDNAIDTEHLSGGIETDKDGAVKKLHILRLHPGSTVASGNRQKWDTVDFFGEKTGRRNVLHLYKTIRADQSRGVPVLSPVMEGLKQFGTLTQATVDAAVIQTFLSVLIETPDGEGLDLPEGDTSRVGSESVRLESAAIIDLAEGEKPHVIDPTHPSDKYGSFAEAFYTQVGMALNIPHEVITKYFQSSYTAAQGALLEAWRYFMSRRSALVDNICQPVYELLIAEEVASGRLPAPGFFVDPAIRAAYCGGEWVGQPRGHIREDVQNKADGYAEDRGWKTGDQNTRERGGEWDRNHRKRVLEVKKRREDGLITTEEHLEKIEEIQE